MDATSIVQAVTAVVVAGFTIALTWVASRQADILQNQADIQQSTLKVATTAAEAARKSADLAETSLVNVERPYLTIDGIDRYIFWVQRESEANPNVQIKVKNHGRTPAFVLELKAALELISATTESQRARVIPNVPVRPLEESVVISSDTVWSFTCRYGNRISDGEKAQIERGEFEFWLFVSLRYEDIFRQQHVTQMRSKYIPSPHSSQGERFVQLPEDNYTIRT